MQKILTAYLKVASLFRAKEFYLSGPAETSHLLGTRRILLSQRDGAFREHVQKCSDYEVCQVDYPEVKDCKNSARTLSESSSPAHSITSLSSSGKYFTVGFLTVRHNLSLVCAL